MPQLAASQEDVRFASGQVMKNLIAECVDGGAVALPAGGPSPLQGVFSALESSLAASHQESWTAALSGAALQAFYIAWLQLGSDASCR